MSYGQKWFWNFLSASNKKKVQVLRIFFVSVIQSTTHKKYGAQKLVKSLSYWQVFGRHFDGAQNDEFTFVKTSFCGKTCQKVVK